MSNTSADAEPAIQAEPAHFWGRLPAWHRRLPGWVISLWLHALAFGLLVLAMTVTTRRTAWQSRQAVPISSNTISPQVDLQEFSAAESVSVPPLKVESVVDLALGEVLFEPNRSEVPDLTTQAGGDAFDAATGLDEGDALQQIVAVIGGISEGYAIPVDRIRSPVRCIRYCGRTHRDPSSIDIALNWLAKHQEPDGHWDTVKYGADEASRCDTAATGLAVLAFLGAGETDKRGQYKQTVRNALEWIVLHQDKDGCIQPGANGKEIGYGPGYHHAICGMALAQAYGMSRSGWLKTAAQKAVDYSVKHQHVQDGKPLGWRYTANQPGDLSVTTWFILQLKEARLATLHVPPEAFHGAIQFLDSVEQIESVVPAVTADAPATATLEVKTPGTSETATAATTAITIHRFRYQPNRTSSPMATVLGCTARMFLGWPMEDYQAGFSEAVKSKGVPTWGQAGENVDWHYVYFGTINAFQMGGDTWQTWNTGLREDLLTHFRADGDEKGSFDPTGPYAKLGRVYSTANATLCSEVYWHGYRPLYKKQAR